MKILKNHPWLIFLVGILVGLVIFWIYSGAKSNNIEPENKEDTLVTFDIKLSDHFLGSFNADNTIVVFNDYTCPYCKEYALTLEEFAKNNKNTRIVWKHFPLDQNDLSASLSAECADEQGLFWLYSSDLYSSEEEFNSYLYLDIAKNLDLDLEQFTNCLESQKYASKVKADYHLGIIKGVIGSPATFINGTYVAGAIPLEGLEELIK
jgi:protein-disulfide isomerase